MRKMWAVIAMLGLAAQGQAVTTGVDFLKLSIGARAAGMGEAFTAVAPDVTASYWNPAGLARLERPELGIVHSEAVIDATLGFVGFAYPLRHGTLAVSGIFYIVKPIPVTLGSGAVLGELNWMDGALVVSYGRKITDTLSCGVGGKFVQRLESDPIFGRSEGSAYAADLGFLYETPVRGLDAGLAILNTGTALGMSGEVKKDALPQTTRAGLAYSRRLDGNSSLVVASDVHRILDGNWYLNGGVELDFQDFFFVRTGYYRKEGNIEGTTYGLGFRIKDLRIDYSNVPSSEMAGYTRNSKVSVMVRF